MGNKRERRKRRKEKHVNITTKKQVSKGKKRQKRREKVFGEYFKRRER